MTAPISTYSFLPWLRQGIAQRIKTLDGDPNVRLRTSIDVNIKIKGRGLDGVTRSSDTITKKIHIYGPGDIVGIESRAIVKTEPRNWITNFEPNYIPCIDFYDEDFPWRYTPAAQPDDDEIDKHRLRPWITLVVLKEDEFEEGKNIKDKLLPYIKVVNASSVFPPADQLWAWAHVQVNRNIAGADETIVSTEMGTVMTKFIDVLKEDPDLAYSRLMCPRRLEANVGYHAFLIPTFEDGRLAGLGLDLTVPGPDQKTVPKDHAATLTAWEDYPDTTTDPKDEAALFPYYHRWYFRTGNVGDFEYLVRLLEPKPVDKEVGRRDLDARDPHPLVSGIDEEALDGVLKLGGALQVPFKTLKKEDKKEVKKYDNWDHGAQEEPDNEAYPHDFQKDLAAFINLADDYSEKSARQIHSNINADEDLNMVISIDTEEPDDPLIAPPLYGRSHAQQQRLLEDRDGNEFTYNKNWVHQLNLDPRYRIAAGFGAKVVQQNQEQYMNAAWEQIGEVLEANQQIRQGQMAEETSTSWYRRHILSTQRANPEKAFMLTAPVQSRVMSQGYTVSHQLVTSNVPRAVTTCPARRMLRPGSRMMKKLAFTGPVQPHNLIARLDKQVVTPAPPKTIASGVINVGHFSEQMLPTSVPAIIVSLLRKYSWLKYFPLVLAVLVVIFLWVFSASNNLSAIGGVFIAGLLYFFRVLFRLSRQIDHADSVLDDNQIPEAADNLPKSPDFRLSEPGEAFTPTPGKIDSVEALNFKTALKSANSLFVASRSAAKAIEDSVTPARHELNLPAVINTTIKAIDPSHTIAKRLFAKMKRPKRFTESTGEDVQEVMAYPELYTPMYKPLVNISSEHFLPNINKVEQNSVTLLETNQAFIEAYMVGINHEFSRELLWREYPTDQRGTYFRQFWDPSSYIDATETDPVQLRKKLLDIPPLHEWRPPLKPPNSKLGDHDHREVGGTKEEEVVLVVRGELLKKYPNAVIYAHHAKWQKINCDIDNSKPRLLVELSPEDEETLPDDKIRMPLYKAEAEPDIFFFGFDITATVARGDTGEQDNDEPGWFFVIKERPGEARFGADIEVSREIAEITVWNDLAWSDVLPGNVVGSYIPMDDSTPTLNVSAEPLPDNDPRLAQWQNDKNVEWNSNASAADIAYILYQAPMMVAVHGSEMLEKETNNTD